MDSRQWEAQVRALAGGYRVLRVDPRGMGRSAPPTTPFSYSDDLAALLEALDIEQAVVVGLSFAGGVALDFALTHPKRALGVVAVAPSVSGYTFSPAMAERLATLRAVLERGPSKFLDALLADPHFIPAPDNPAARERARQLISENLPALQGGDPTLVRLPEPPAVERLEQIRAPVLLVLGDRDHPDLYELARVLGARVPNLQRVTIAGSGHTVNMEQPEALSEAISTFLSRLRCEG
jgi:pimeloyl-ACP methyl ester carboxylesterase